MKKILAVVFVIIISLPTKVLGQEHFTDSLFVKQLEEEIKKYYSKRPGLKQTFDLFTTMWQNYLQPYQDEVIETVNFFYGDNKFYPSVPDYLEIINTLAASDNLDTYSRWNSKMLGYLKKNTTKSYGYQILNITNSFVVDSLLTLNSAVKIKGVYDDYSFSFADNSFQVKFPSGLDLILFNNTDTIKITDTKGHFDFNRKRFLGQGGTIYWEKFDPIGRNIYVKLGEYNINANSKTNTIENVSATADLPSVKFNNLKGKLVLQFTSSPAVAQKNPKFTAYNEIQAQNFVPSGDFKGFVIIEGKEIITSGTIDFYKKTEGLRTKLITTKSDRYIVKPNLVRSTKTQMTIFLLDSLADTFAIEHPEVEMKLFIDSGYIKAFYPHLANQALKYDPPRLLSFARGQNGRSAAPFSDSYHGIEIYTDELIWTYGDFIYLKVSSTNLYKRMDIFSKDFYTQKLINEFYDSQGTNYAKLLYQYWRKKNKPDTISFDAFSSYVIHRLKVRTGPKTIEAFLQKMEARGWIKYNIESPTNKYISDISPVFIHTMKASLRDLYKKSPKKLQKYTEDYDMLHLVCETKRNENNVKDLRTQMFHRNTGILGELNLDDLNLTVTNVKPFYLSGKRGVAVKTDTVVISKNRTLIFDGLIHAGLTEYKGTNFVFRYDSFKVEMPKIDSMTLAYYPAVDSSILITENNDTLYKYTYKMVPVHLISVLRNFKGELQIDTAADKSGVLAKENDIYPYFYSKTRSKIYYDVDYLDTSEFYFANYKFRLNNLSFLTKENVSMQGTFHSTILEDLDSLTLTVQPDSSLGFVKFDTTQGYKIFGNAKLKGYMQLDGKGLHTVAWLDFLSLRAKGSFDLTNIQLKGIADTIIIKPVSKDYMIKQNYESTYPYMRTKEAKVSLTLSHVDSNLQNMSLIPVGKTEYEIYQNLLKPGDKGIYTGILYYSQLGTRGWGKMLFKDAIIESDDFYFQYDNFTGNNTQFTLIDSTTGKSIFTTANLISDVDLVSRIGTFVSSDSLSTINFPENNFLCKMDHFQWKINEGLIDIGGELNNPDYYVASDESERDSLINAGRSASLVRLEGTILESTDWRKIRFEAQKSVYNPAKKIITAYSVKNIKIADAYIMPSLPVTIEEKGFIDTLKNTKIKLDTFNHVFYNANVVVNSYKDYWAEGYYKYPPDQKIFFDSIGVNRDTITVARARLKAGKSIALNPYFKFKGKPGMPNVSLRGDQKLLSFSGFVFINNLCNRKLKSYPVVIWNAPINPDTVLIPVGYPIQSEPKTLYASPIIHKIPGNKYKMYNTFLTPLRNPTDSVVYKVKGYLYYDKHKAYYKISDTLNLFNPDTVGQYVAFDAKRCLLFGEGDISFGVKYSGLDYRAVGFYSSNNYSASVKYNFPSTLLGFKFYFPDEIMTMIRKAIEDNEEAEIADYANNVKLRKNIMNWCTNESELTDFTINEKLPASMNDYTLMFGDVYLRWDSARFSFRTPADYNQFAVLGINGKAVELYTHGYMEIQMGRLGVKRVYIFLEPQEGQWFFFVYELRDGEGTMRILSSDGKAEKIISAMKPKERKITKKYYIGTAEPTELNRFLKIYGRHINISDL